MNVLNFVKNGNSKSENIIIVIWCLLQNLIHIDQMVSVSQK